MNIPTCSFWRACALFAVIAAATGITPSSLVDAADGKPHAVFLIGEREYKTNITLPAFATAELLPRGYECTFVHAAGDEGPERNQFPGIGAVDDADLLILSTRRRTLPTADLQRVRQHIASGKPVIAIRTACHGFALRKGDPPEGLAQWQTFDRDVMGIRYDNHLRSHETTYAPTDAEHPVLNGVPADALSSDGTLYRMYELADDATLLLNGTAQDGDAPETYPAAWVRTTDSGSRVFATTIGHESDFRSPAIRKMLVNACAWCLDDESLAKGPSVSGLAMTYGFEPVEVYELDWRSFGVQAGDFNDDGRTDLVAADNRKSRLAIFLQRATPSAADTSDATVSSSRPNAIADPSRFEQHSVLVDRAITALAVGDIDGDGRTDIVTLERPERLVVRLQRDGQFDESQTIQIPDLGEGSFDVAIGDLDADGDADVVAVTARSTMLFESRGAEGLGTGAEYLNTSDEIGLLQLADVNGDDKLDWFYSARNDSGSNLCTRLQRGTPLEFGPELRLTEDESRALAIADADGASGSEFFTIDAQTGRLEALRYGVQAAADDAALSDRVTQYGLTGGRQDRAAAIGDFDGDGGLDVVVADPNAAEMLLFRQGSAGLLPAERTPTLLGVTAMAASDFDEDGRDELIVVSEEEASLGIVSWDADQQGLRFPVVLPRSDLVTLKSVAVPAYVSENRRGFVVAGDLGRTGSAFATYALADGEWKLDKTTPIADHPAGLADAALLTLDADRDSRTDFLCVPRRSNPKLLCSDDAGQLSEVSGGLSLPRVERAEVSVTSDDQALLVAQDKFIRRMTLDAQRQWQVDVQYNIPARDARFAAAVNFGPSDSPSVAAYDEQGGRVFVFSGSEPAVGIDVGGFDVQAMFGADFDGDGSDDVLLIGAERLALVRSAGTKPVLKTVFTFETDDEKAFLADVVVGDINGDDQADLIVNETRQHTIAVLALRDGMTKPVQALRFKLFEEKSFSSSRERPGLQPREMIVADVTGDGRNDLVMLCHDRLLIHPQDGPDVK